MEEISLCCSTKLSRHSAAIISGMEEIPPPNPWRLIHGSITITSGVQKMPLNFTIPNHGRITVILVSGAEEIPVHSSRRLMMISLFM